jgi:hypothetical protein
MSTIIELGESIASFEDSLSQIEQGLNIKLGILSNQRADLYKLIDAQYQTSITEIETMLKAIKRLRGIDEDQVTLGR